MKDDFRNGLNTENERQYKRKEILAEMSYRELVPSGKKGIIQNTSEGGLCLLLNKEISLNSILEVKYELKDMASKAKEAFVQIVWQKKTGNGFLTGVRFLK